MARWMLKIQAFTPIVKHLPGKQNLLVDLLSRRNTMEELEENVEEEIRVEGVNAIIARDPSTHLWVNAPWDSDVHKKYQKKDEHLGPIYHALENQVSPQAEIKNFTSYYMEHGILYKILVNKRLRENVKITVICIPDHYIQKACKIIHVHSGHASLEKSVLSEGSLIYYVNLENQMKEVIKDCVQCFEEKSKVDPQSLELVPVPCESFQCTSLDN